MSQTSRALIGFLLAPAFPSALLYLYNFFWMGYGDAAVAFPFILVVFAYTAALVLGVPVYLILQRKGIHSLSAYCLLGALIGPIWYAAVDILLAYPGTLAVRLQYAYGGALIAAAYSLAAATAFWSIAFWPRQASPVVQ